MARSCTAARGALQRISPSDGPPGGGRPRRVRACAGAVGPYRTSGEDADHDGAFDCRDALIDPGIATPGLDRRLLPGYVRYERLQRVKAHWDPWNVFRHAQSVRLPGENSPADG
ncbi:BBE domain-containing protein [Streptomyces griseochromogenes]|uniref:BBE domain-containing protein n=1 Tax=Streptomyces griseochromogenes TaxID=68214 RepID=UPI00378AE83B